MYGRICSRTLRVRFFFRLHQEHEHTRREDERRQQEAARKLEREVLGDAADDNGDGDDGDDDDLVQDDGDAALAPESGAELALQPQVDSSSSDADKRAARAWKKKALELQTKLGAMAAELAETTQRITDDKNAQYQQLCDSYEAKMAEVTLQIDDARAIGYDAGIQESEAIIAAMRQAADDEIERLKRQVAGDASASGESESVLALQQALALKTETLATVAAEKVAVETLLLARDDELAALRTQVASQQQTGDSLAPHSSSSDASEALERANARVRDLEAQLAAATAPRTVSSDDNDAHKRELELWRMRAVKMKKAKELVDAEFQAFRDTADAARRADADAFAQQLAAATAQAAAAERRADEAYAAGVDAATLAAKTEIDLLRTEIALLRASAHTHAAGADQTDSEAEPDVIWSVPVPVLGDEFSETDAMSHSIDNLHVAPVSDGDGPESETSDANASVSDDPMSDAPRDDWGEW